MCLVYRPVFFRGKHDQEKYASDSHDTEQYCNRPVGHDLPQCACQELEKYTSYSKQNIKKGVALARICSGR